jgi:serine/threonine-protein kinase
MEQLQTSHATFGAIAPLDEPWRAGDVVGRHFRVREILGSGGMSAVWEADDVSLRRRVALKVTHDAEHSHELMAHEARALAAVRHPGLPTVHELGTHRKWTFLAMERLYGVTLEQRQHQRLRRGPAFEIEEAAAILASVAEVLAAIHSAGMAHHDLKPANVMLCDRGRTVLLDLGIMVPEIDVAYAADCGTPRYLAPEAIVREMKPGMAYRADLYALGIMAFEMLTGRPPFESSTFVELCHDHLVTPPPDVRELRPDAPRAFATLIDACLAKSPDDRPAAADLVAWELRGLSRPLARRTCRA